MIQAAIVGLGWWGKTLVDAVNGKSERLRFVAANTRTRAKAEDFCRERGIDLRDDLDAILSDPAIQAVVFTTPHSQHEEHIARAAAAGKHIFVEKPLAMNSEGARRALAAVDKAGIVLGLGYQRRFHASVAEVRERVKDGRVGTIGFAAGEATAPAGRFLPAESWRVDPEETPAGAMTGMGVHLVDGFIDLLGEVDEVFCVTRRRAAPLVDDTTIVTLMHRSGAVSTISCSIATALYYRVAVYGSGGLAVAEGQGLEGFRYYSAPQKPGEATTTDDIDHSGFNPLKATIDAFAAAVTGEAPFPITAEQMLHGVAVFEAVVESSRTGKPVRVK